MKVILWTLISVGLLPCLFLAMQGIVYWRYQRFVRNEFHIGDWFVHDEYFRIRVGPYSCDLYPRLWAFALLAAGIIAIFVALVVLLHFPKVGPK